jgi:hypothetical protein
VGDDVGSIIGCGVGLLVGGGVGDLVGGRVGDSVGSIVGCGVGLLVGGSDTGASSEAKFGRLVRTAEGLEDVGADVGLIVAGR